jgi:hypothetical protein
VWTQLASDVEQDRIAVEIWQGADHSDPESALVAAVYERDGHWHLDLFAGSVEPEEFLTTIRTAIDRLQVRQD